MSTILTVILGVLIIIIVAMSQRLFNGPTSYDRMNALGVIGADVILALVIFDAADEGAYMYLDISIAYALLGFICSVILAKYLGGGKTI